MEMCFVIVKYIYIYRFPPTFSSNLFSEELAAFKIQVAVVCSGLASIYDLQFALSEVVGKRCNP